MKGGTDQPNDACLSVCTVMTSQPLALSQISAILATNYWKVGVLEGVWIYVINSCLVHSEMPGDADSLQGCRLTCLINMFMMRRIYTRVVLFCLSQACPRV